MSLTHTPITDELAAYIRRVTLREPEVLKRLREEAEGGSPGSIQIGPEQGQFLHLMARILGARKTLEVGVLMGYSSTWVALALPPGGKVVACDCNPEFAARARRTWREAGVADKIELRLAPALETLGALVAEGQANKQVAGELGISIKTVEKHRQSLMQKLHIHDVAGLTRYAIGAGIIESSVQLTIV